MLRALGENRLNVLAVAVPVAWVLAATAPESAWLFLTAAISLVPPPTHARGCAWGVPPSPAPGLQLPLPRAPIGFDGNA